MHIGIINTNNAYGKSVYVNIFSGLIRETHWYRCIYLINIPEPVQYHIYALAFSFDLRLKVLHVYMCIYIYIYIYIYTYPGNYIYTGYFWVNLVYTPSEQHCKTIIYTQSHYNHPYQLQNSLSYTNFETVLLPLQSCKSAEFMLTKYNRWLVITPNAGDNYVIHTSGLFDLPTYQDK